MAKFVAVGYYKVPVFLEYDAEDQDDADHLKTKISPMCRSKNKLLEAWNGNKNDAFIQLHQAVPKKEFDKKMKKDPSCGIFSFLDE